MSQESTLQKEIDAQAFRSIIEHMKFCGFRELENGTVEHDENPVNMTFDSWTQAIKSCIEVATGA